MCSSIYVIYRLIGALLFSKKCKIGGKYVSKTNILNHSKPTQNPQKTLKKKKKKTTIFITKKEVWLLFVLVR
jgi:hypothetical protein